MTLIFCSLHSRPRDVDVSLQRQRTMDAEKLRVSRDKLTRVFRYLEALNQHRNPAKRQIREQPWSFSLSNLPEHPSIQRGGAKASSLKANTGNGQNAEDSGASYVLKVRRPQLTRAPEPPESISAWLRDGWDDPASAFFVDETLRNLLRALRSHRSRGGTRRARPWGRHLELASRGGRHLSPDPSPAPPVAVRRIGTRIHAFGSGPSG